MRIFVSNKTTKYKIMKNANEIKQEIIRLEGVLEKLYELAKGGIYPETTNESIARYETNVNALKWVINQ